MRRAFNAPQRFHFGTYHRPSGWYFHRWTFGEFLPAFFFARNYWILDWANFDLDDPPPGTVWVRVGDDALLIDEYSGEVIEVVYGIFY
jgi:Ni/Co efflux regulator RcnB